MILTLGVDLARGMEPIQFEGMVWTLARWEASVLGEAMVRDVDLSKPHLLIDRLMARFGARVLAGRLAGAPPPGPTPAPHELSMIVVVRDRPALLHGCLRAIDAMDDQPGEVHVVGHHEGLAGSASSFSIHASSGDPVEDMAATLRHASGRVIAFLDERCRPDRRFATSVTRAFVDGRVAAVTGTVAPFHLDTYHQLMFDRRETRRRRVYRHRHWSQANGGFDPIAVHPGVGGGVAYSREALLGAGGFRHSHEGRTRRRAEYEMLQRLVAAGLVVGHDPDVVLWHVHPRTREEILDWVRDAASDRSGYLAATQFSGGRDVALAQRIHRASKSLRRGRLLELQVDLAEASAYLSTRRRGIGRP